LDPFKQYTEEQIWDALERTHMKECVSEELLESCAVIVRVGTQGFCPSSSFFCSSLSLAADFPSCSRMSVEECFEAGLLRHVTCILKPGLFQSHLPLPVVILASYYPFD
jgi:hypothetical protein